MKKILIISLSMAFVYSAANAQTGDSVIVTGEAFIPIEGRAQTPANLAGSWVLTSGLKAKNKEKAKEFYEKKPEPGTETRRDTKTTTAANGETTTEVEYDIIAKPVKQITPRQKSKMHKPEKPSINFFGLNQTFSGFTGCNKISGRYTLSGNKMNITADNPATQMVCMGDYDEKDFINKLNKVDSYKASNGRLELIGGGDVLLVFGRK